VNAGDRVAYTFSVENTGNVTVTNITVTDPRLPALGCAIASLAPGGTTSCTPTNNIYTLTQADVDAGLIVNSATATAADPGNNAVTDSDTQSTNLGQSPRLALTKTGTLDDTVIPPSAMANAGDAVTYTFSVANTGNVTITNISVTDPLLPGLTCALSSLAPGASASCTPTNNVYILTQTDIDAGARPNTATATGKDPADQNVTDTDTQTTTIAKSPSLRTVKEVSADNKNWNDVSVAVTVGDTVHYRVRVSNTGNTTQTGLMVDDGMAACTLVRDTDLTGNNDNVFEAGEEWAYTCSVTAELGMHNNTVTAATNETSGASDSASYVAGAVQVADPAIAKVGDPTQASVGDTVMFTLTVTNGGNAPAPNIVITDVLPAIFDVTAVNVRGAPLGTLVNVTPLIGTGPGPYTVIVTLGGDLGVTDVVTIDIVTIVNSLGNPPINNTASLTTSAVTDIASNNATSVTITIRDVASKKLPATGFARDRTTLLAPQSPELAYAPTDLVLEIPGLSIRIPVVGVPKKNGAWNVSWLGSQAGWLQGSAFPSWNGNSLLTSHVYLSNGLPGPFVHLNKLKYGDQIIVHAYGEKYTFAVQTNAVVEPNDVSALKHEEKPWLTLITCQEFDEKTNTYLKRVVVRAVLISVTPE
jgi:LPXTG-site transpeptidase (sortase) family protein